MSENLSSPFHYSLSPSVVCFEHDGGRLVAMALLKSAENRKDLTPCQSPRFSAMVEAPRSQVPTIYSYGEVLRLTVLRQPGLPLGSIRRRMD
ncbi:hypothetical protein GOP47_0023943 [Adiantum capillus-veneris]|uniref:Uncharacterized protein n=1 Tax=Adiantum capillus-veneris TaxID=13818 RepID=A0A9D4U4N7_ADICA|nr:hypothetical protein GOP47_0023943 [Adiantum capillus-veneris]